MTTKEAWLKMINTDGIEKVLGYTLKTLLQKQRQANEHNIFPSVDTMEKHLLKAGWKVVQEKLWADPKSVNKTLRKVIKQLNKDFLKGGISRKLAGEK